MRRFPKSKGDTNLEDGALNVGVGDALDVAIAHFLVPDLRAWAERPVKG
jgi:hypothetical protein